jgi:Xaa-Pro dipeptidase
MRIRKALVVDGKTLVSEEAWNAELEEKHRKLVDWMTAERLDAVLIRRNENVAWLTGGAVEVRVRTTSETGVASLLVTKEGARYYFTGANEAARLHDEEFGALDFEAVIFPWYGDATAETALRLGRDQVGSDTPMMGFVTVNLYPLRMAMTEPEIARFKWLGAQTGEVVSDVLPNLEPGMTEFEMEAQVAAGLLSRGILPTVYLMAVDDRIFKYKHAVARGAAMKRYGMLNLCARRWGLTVSITRFAFVGAVPAELQEKFMAAAQVNAALLNATRVGVSSAELFRVAAEAYAATGFAGDEQRHHQGGATGYVEREWVATPSGSETVVDGQVFAWNPSVRGGKVEDTVLLRDGAIELLTPTPELPVLESRAGGTSYPACGVLGV